MKNRRARQILKVANFTIGRDFCTIRISNRRRAVCTRNGRFLYAEQSKPSARQNRWNNHCHLVEARP